MKSRYHHNICDRTLPLQMNRHERFPSISDVGGVKSCGPSASLELSGYLIIVMRHSTVMPLIPIKAGGCVFINLKGTTSFNCEMEKSAHKSRFVSEQIRGAEHAVDRVRVLYRDWRLSAATVLTLAPAALSHCKGAEDCHAPTGSIWNVSLCWVKMFYHQLQITKT